MGIKSPWFIYFKVWVVIGLLLFISSYSCNNDLTVIFNDGSYKHHYRKTVHAIGYDD